MDVTIREHGGNERKLKAAEGVGIRVDIQWYRYAPQMPPDVLLSLPHPDQVSCSSNYPYQLVVLTIQPMLVCWPRPAEHPLVVGAPRPGR